MFGEYAIEQVLHRSSPTLSVIIVNQKFFCNQTVDSPMIDLFSTKIGLIPDDARNNVTIGPHETYMSRSVGSLLCMR